MGGTGTASPSQVLLGGPALFRPALVPMGVQTEVGMKEAPAQQAAGTPSALGLISSRVLLPTSWSLSFPRAEWNLEPPVTPQTLPVR